MGERAENRELDVGAPETRFSEDPAHERVVEDGQYELLEFNLDGRGVGGELVVEVEVVGEPALVGLRALDGGHEGVGDGRVVAGVARGDPVQGDAEAELQGFELEAGGVGGVACTRAGVA